MSAGKFQAVFLKYHASNDSIGLGLVRLQSYSISKYWGVHLKVFETFNLRRLSAVKSLEKPSTNINRLAIAYKRADSNVVFF